MLEPVTRVRGKVMLSGCRSDLYDEALTDLEASGLRHTEQLRAREDEARMRTSGRR
ncbi:hypothetical protein FTUN_2443 [Frigoriglobus tundricola]|uniref:Uncharacterized protein n=1 Tax=Frigoriglobus tundricola TaxID=2774151 RepID=A0A6M5YLK9_9BACT|nr:hypothetical protein FTUN_2443 [Frigoriglobus tundricola]